MAAALSPRLQAWRAAGTVVSWQGLPVFVRDEGDGPAVLLLHGYPTGSYDWHAVWPLLQPGRRLVAPDFPGLGFSGKPRGAAYTLDRQAEAVEAVLAARGLSSVHVVAHDLGVRVAQALLARRAEGGAGPQVRSLVLLNGAMCPEAYRPRPVQRLLASPLGAWVGPRLPRRAAQRAIAGLFGAATPPSPELLEDFWALVVAGGGREVTHAVGRFWRVSPPQRDRLVGALQRCGVPLRVVNGSADPNSGEAMVQRWLSLEPRADVVRLPAIGHWPQIEAPQATADAILAFWSSLEGQ